MAAYPLMTISFVIPAYNEEGYIEACIESIRKHWTSDFLEIIVVDNASTDGTAAKAAVIPGVRVVKETRRGTNWARERGFRESRGELVAYLDADARIPHGWAAKVQKEFAANPKLVCLSGPFRYYDLSLRTRILAEGLWWIFAPITYRILGYAALGANLVARRDALTEIGGLDTTLVFHGDDTDTARRLSKVGKVKFDMGFFVLGSGRRLAKDGIFKLYITYGLNFLWIIRTHRPYTEGYVPPGPPEKNSPGR